MIERNTRAKVKKNSRERVKVCCVIPAYKCSNSVCSVVADVLPYVDDVIVVDDGCPHSSGHAVAAKFSEHPRVHVVTLDRNRGVGGAVKAGIEKALQLQSDVIVKVDADGQMDPSYIPAMANLISADPDLCLVKGNRFTNESVLRDMPALRLLGNSVLSLFVRFASGYWDMLDPTNGYLAFNARLLEAINWRKFSDSYFFETSVICGSGLKRARVAEVEMPTIYGDENSSLSVYRSAVEFPPKLLLRFLQRILLQYFVFDINVASIYLFLGTLLCLFGLSFGCYEWLATIATGVPRTTGTVMLAALPILMGFQLLLNSVLYDVQFGPKIFRRPLALRTHARKQHERHYFVQDDPSSAHGG